MQLKPKAKSTSIRKKLATATFALLSLQSAVVRSSEPEVKETEIQNSSTEGKTKWQGSFGHLYYSESNRVSVQEPSLEITAKFPHGQKWKTKVTYDSITGVSHNGGVPARTAQTFTSPSGRHTYATNANELPLDTSFKDTRIALNSSYMFPMKKDIELTGGANVSDEYDFTSLGANLSFSKSFNQKNTQFSFGLSFEQDLLNPVGGAPVPFSDMATKQTSDLNKQKNVYDMLTGITQVISRTLIVQANYSLGITEGYLNDPYKILTLVEPSSSGNAGDPTGFYRYENRPNRRMRNSVQIGAKQHLFKDSVLTSSYRYYWDDWNVFSHTLDFDYRTPIAKSWYITPDVRFYRQTAAQFYKYYLIEGDPLPRHASADSRLGQMTAYTIGLKLTKVMTDFGRDINLHVQYYQQQGEGRPSSAFGSLRQFDLSPKLTVMMARLIFNF